MNAVKKARVMEIPQNDDNGRFSVGKEAETFPEHEAGCHDRCKVEYLQKDLDD